MKNFKLNSMMGWVLLVAVIAMGAKIGENILRIGDTTGADIEIQMGSGRLKWDDAAQKMQFSNDAGTSVQDIGSGSGGASGVNVLENGDFESGNPPANFTASGGAFTANTGTPGFGSQSGNFDASAASQNLDSDLQAVPVGLENRSCNATIQYDYPAGSSGDYKLQVVANTAGLIAEKDLDVTTDWKKDALQFTCPTSDSIRIRITSTVDAGAIDLDNFTLGKTDFVDISQAEIFGSASWLAGDCNWTSTSGTYAVPAVDGSCTAPVVEGKVLAPDTNLPQIKISTLPAGKYEVFFDVNLLQNGQTIDTQCNVRITDGLGNGDTYFVGRSTGDSNAADHDSTTRATAIFTYSAVQTNHTFTLEMARSAGDGTCDVNAAALLNRTLFAGVKRFPTSSAEAITLETSGGALKVAWDDSNCSWTRVSSSYGPFNPDNTCTETISQSGAFSGVQVVDSGGKLPEVTFNSNRATKAKVCFSYFLSKGSSDGLSSAVQLYDVIDAKVLTAESFRLANIINRQFSGDLCSIVDIKTGLNHLAMYGRDAGGGTIEVTPFEPGIMSLEVFEISNQFPTPVFTDLQNSLDSKVASNSSSTKMCAVSVNSTCTVDPCIINTEIGDCVTTVNRSGTGAYDVNFEAGYWDGANNIVCVVGQKDATAADICKQNSAPNTTSASIQCRNSTTAAALDSRFDMICFGIAQ